MMKKAYEAAELEILYFGVEDVVVTSGEEDFGGGDTVESSSPNADLREGLMQLLPTTLCG